MALLPLMHASGGHSSHLQTQCWHYVPQHAESGSNAPSFDTQMKRGTFHTRAA